MSFHPDVMFYSKLIQTLMGIVGGLICKTDNMRVSWYRGV